jgi:hypothetical protein
VADVGDDGVEEDGNDGNGAGTDGSGGGSDGSGGGGTEAGGCDDDGRLDGDGGEDGAGEAGEAGLDADGECDCDAGASAAACPGCPDKGDGADAPRLGTAGTTAGATTGPHRTPGEA